MQHYHKISHGVYYVTYHLVLITKYRKPILLEKRAWRLRELFRGYCKELDVEIFKGHFSRDHVHLFVSVPPYISVSKVVQKLKGKSSYKMLR